MCRITQEVIRKLADNAEVGGVGMDRSTQENQMVHAEEVPSDSYLVHTEGGGTRIVHKTKWSRLTLAYEKN